jgi:hypothetical protein
VVGPTLAPVRAGERVKIDRQDAAKLARRYGAGDPDASVGARGRSRSVARAGADPRRQARSAASPQRLEKFRLRRSCQRPEDVKQNWTSKHMD